MLGNEADARFIRDWYTCELEKPTYNQLRDAPEGWTRVDAGCYRTVFLSPGGVVYKVEQRYAKPGGHEGQSNKTEAANLRKYWLTKMPEGCRMPRWGFFELGGRGVIAMECFKKTLSAYSAYDSPGSDYWARVRLLQRALDDIYDLHGGNMAVDEENQKLVPIDLGG